MRCCGAVLTHQGWRRFNCIAQCDRCNCATSWGADSGNAVQVHHKWPAKLAQMCAETPSVERLIQVSCLGADVDSPSPRLASKARGDIAVQEAFPNATLFRCGPLVGNEDRFFNDLALWRFSNSGVPVVDGGYNVLQPVWVVDVAEAIYKSLEFEDAKGSTYELGGRERLSCASLT